MKSKISEQPQSLPRNLKRSFETAVRDIYEAGLTGKVSTYRTPIVQRTRAAVPESGKSAEKRALSDAANALKLLWKVSPNSGR